MNLSRRSFIKLLALSPLLASDLSKLGESSHRGATGKDDPNVLILVFDTLSALHISLYGYSRETMPNLAKFAENATVYHSHYSSGNFTTPGTASILTGTYPWTCRAFSHQATLLEEFTDKNIFSEFGKLDYTRIGFSHNLLANILLHGLRHHIDHYTLPNDIALADFNLLEDIFFEDYVTAARSERVYLNKPGDLSNSLFLSSIYWAVKMFFTRMIEGEYRDRYPNGLPGYHEMIYTLEDTIDWVVDELLACSQPFLSYLHFMPPHDPYLPSTPFTSLFYDEWRPVSKPPHFYSEGVSDELLDIHRRRYDQYIAYVDGQFGRFIEHMQSEGMLGNTWVVLTSDHGEMFERGIWKHTTRTLFQPIIRIPLLISPPGQDTRQDVHTLTSSVDLLPTLLHAVGQSIPDWIEGQVLPPYSEKVPERDRSVFVVEAKSNPKFGPLTKGTVAMIKGSYKLVYYTGYEGFDGEFELFNLEEDPEELEDLYGSLNSVRRSLEDELLERVNQINRPYMRNS